VPLTSASESRGGAPFGSERDAAEPARRVCALLAFAALRAAVRPMGARGLPGASSAGAPSKLRTARTATASAQTAKP
jgi:hypothetical protein